MKIHKSIGSKERFLEMFQGVNKVKLNENYDGINIPSNYTDNWTPEQIKAAKDNYLKSNIDISNLNDDEFETMMGDYEISLREVSTNAVENGGQLIVKAFEELKNKQAQIKQTNSQTVGEDNFVEIITNDNEGNEITFTFKVGSNEADQDGVFNLDNGVLTKFKVVSERFNVEWDENMKFVQEFNANHGAEITDVVSEYVNLETDTANVDDEIYEDAIKLIDKVPYKKGTETMQTNKAYGDQKPTNPDLRVHATELDKFVSEMEDYVNNAEEDPLALPNDYGDDVLSNDDGSIGVDPYDQAIADAEAGNNDWKIEKRPEKTGERTRAIPKWAEAFMENDEVTNMDADNLVKQNYNNLLSDEMKEELIIQADKFFNTQLGVKISQIPKEKYVVMVKNKALEFYQKGSADVNEEIEKGDYPNQMGKKFKPKDQMPKKKKKPQSIVKLSEEDSVDVEVGNELEGGLGDDKSTLNFCPEQLAMGLTVEMKEHTNDPKVALEIAIDHLMEDPEYYGNGEENPDEMAKIQAQDDAKEVETPESENDLETDELLGYKPHNVNDYTSETEYQDKEEHPLKDVMDGDGTEEDLSKNNFGEKGRNLAEDEEFDEYSGEIGDRYQDANNNQLTVREKIDGGVTLQGQDGDREIGTGDLQFLKKLGEGKKSEKNVLNEEELKTAKLVLKDRNFSTKMTKKEAVQILIKHNIR